MIHASRDGSKRRIQLPYPCGAMLFPALLSISAKCLAREVRATLSGTITDSSGSAVPNAQVRLTSVDTANGFAAVSSERGQYRFLFINAGEYGLSVEAPGYHTFVREDLQLAIGQAATLDVQLQVGSQAETVTVAAAAPVLEAEKADHGMVVDQNPERVQISIGQHSWQPALRQPGCVASRITSPFLR
jgi:hypothetical protein